MAGVADGTVASAPPRVAAAAVPAAFGYPDGAAAVAVPAASGFTGKAAAAAGAAAVEYAGGAAAALCDLAELAGLPGLLALHLTAAESHNETCRSMDHVHACRGQQVAVPF